MTTTALYPLIWKIRRVFQQLRSASNTMLEDMGVNASQRAILEVLSDEERFSVPQIAKKLSVTRQHVQVLVNELVEKKLLISFDNPSHKRSPLIGLTEEGLSLFTAITERERAMLNRLQSSFSNSELAISINTLETLEELLQANQ